MAQNCCYLTNHAKVSYEAAKRERGESVQYLVHKTYCRVQGDMYKRARSESRDEVIKRKDTRKAVTEERPNGVRGKNTQCWLTPTKSQQVTIFFETYGKERFFKISAQAPVLPLRRLLGNRGHFEGEFFDVSIFQFSDFRFFVDVLSKNFTNIAQKKDKVESVKDGLKVNTFILF